MAHRRQPRNPLGLTWGFWYFRRSVPREEMTSASRLHRWAWHPKAILPFSEGQYDSIHVQLFLCVLQKDGTLRILRELSKLLNTYRESNPSQAPPNIKNISLIALYCKVRRVFPMGWIWPSFFQRCVAEAGTQAICKWPTRTDHSRTGRKPNDVKYICSIVSEDCHSSIQFLVLILARSPSKFSTFIEDAGLETIAFNQYPLPAELYAPLMQCHLRSAEEVSFTAMENDGVNAQVPLFRRFLVEIQRECQTDVKMTETPLVLWRRPDP